MYCRCYFLCLSKVGGAVEPIARSGQNYTTAATPASVQQSDVSGTCHQVVRISSISAAVVLVARVCRRRYEVRSKLSHTSSSSSSCAAIVLSTPVTLILRGAQLCRALSTLGTKSDLYPPPKRCYVTAWPSRESSAAGEAPLHASYLIPYAREAWTFCCTR